MSPRPWVLLPLLCLGWTVPEAAGQDPLPDPATIRRRLIASNGKGPWTPATGYRLEGAFIYKGLLDEIACRAAYHRRGERWSADYAGMDSTRNLRFAGDGDAAWAASPEATVDTAPANLPFCAQLDFPLLYDALLEILDRAAEDPLFRVEREGNDLYIQGRLGEESEAIFLIPAADFFPRKVTIRSDSRPLPAWAFPALKGDGSPEIQLYPDRRSSRFELWFSDPLERDGYRLPRRTDYVAAEGVVGTFVLERALAADGADPLLDKPGRLPWAAGLPARFPRADRAPNPIHLDAEARASLRSRLATEPWAEWAGSNRTLALWGRIALALSLVIPEITSPRAWLLSMGLVLMVFVWLLARRRRTTGRFSGRLFLYGTVIWGCVLVAGFLRMPLRTAVDQGRIAVQFALRSIIADSDGYARAARRILESPDRFPSLSLLDRAEACRSYASAYDLIRPSLQAEEAERIEAALVDYARPLYGTIHGWRSRSALGASTAASLGLVGLAAGYEPFVTAAGHALETAFDRAFEGGLHREGIGPGTSVLQNAAALALALERYGGRRPAWRPDLESHTRSLLQVLSPVGTLPLLGHTGLRDSEEAAVLFLRMANHLPANLAGSAEHAFELYKERGRHRPGGLRGFFLEFAEPWTFFYRHPYVLWDYERETSGGALQEASAVLGEGQLAVLRSGSGSDSAYLALNCMRSDPAEARRDILGFDVYAHGSLLLHGPGTAGRHAPHAAAAERTSSANAVTLDGRDQSGTSPTGIRASLLNQPVFDWVRATGDRIYHAGRMLRDAVLVRETNGKSPYFLLVDEIHTDDPATRVAWHLHGRGEPAVGLDQVARWSTFPFHASSERARRVTLYARAFSPPSPFRIERGGLRGTGPDLQSATMLMEWEGSHRLAAVLFPRRADQPEPVFEAIGAEGSGRIAETDWVSLGDLETRRTSGPVRHVSECVVVRERSGFPAVLMIGGIEFQTGPHSIRSDKPVTVSLDGLRGGLLNSRPATTVQIASPSIRAGDSYLLDGQPVPPHADGLLVLTLDGPGTHELEQAPAGGSPRNATPAR